MSIYFILRQSNQSFTTFCNTLHVLLHTCKLLAIVFISTLAHIRRTGGSLNRLSYDRPATNLMLLGDFNCITFNSMGKMAFCISSPTHEANYRSWAGNVWTSCHTKLNIGSIIIYTREVIFWSKGKRGNISCSIQERTEKGMVSELCLTYS